MIIYEDVDLFKVLHELQEVFPEHYEELNVVDLDLDPDYDAYRRWAGACRMARGWQMPR